MCMAILAFMPLPALSTTSPSPEHQPLEAIHSQALEFLKQKVDQKLHNPKIHLKKLSSRIRLPRCETPLQIHDRTPNKIAGRVTLGIKCKNPAWQTFLSATIEGELAAVISTQGILKQAVIKPEDVKQVYVNYKKVGDDSLISAEKAIGMRAKKAIGPNEILTIRDLQPPYWVFKKHPVNLISKIGTVEVKTKGVALSDAVEGEQVQVENSATGKTVRGIVIAPNTVLVP
ncbi:flagellar basal body P-ring formation chaperone FlgA [Thiomicrorhabdus sp. zzn3]|uniref:flagellar basal body P-ring formation chaperone FlgA n=1 Tax=Thiomicrorhabdus sp. zzn3 TaxID=3039775 RepID=UPI0024362DB6|nr:flagellar basal body P-ring formation chaperone FlgA [Thiomicrorhabdus sp. zzn3]MDG6777591.1 flagellar basal body P-ring formation chaperone FlgA [Thiomicrorhabdus sp. zzn3]